MWGKESGIEGAVHLELGLGACPRVTVGSVLQPRPAKAVQK